MDQDAIEERQTQALCARCGARIPDEETRCAGCAAASPGSGTQGAIGPYQIRRELGHGALGTVYECHDGLDERTLAVKLLASEGLAASPNASSFVATTRAVGRLSHPAIPQVHALGRADGQPFLVTEYVDGVSLRTLLGERASIAPRPALLLIRDAAEGLDVAAGAGIFHGDVKPGHLLLSTSGTVKIIDFGLGSGVGDASARAPHYLSPEQARGLPSDRRSDIYALGACLHHMLTGAPPFKATSLSQLRYLHLTEPLPPLDQVAPYLGADVARLVARMTAVTPAARHQLYPELVAEIEAVLSALEAPMTAAPAETAAATLALT